MSNMHLGFLFDINTLLNPLEISGKMLINSDETFSPDEKFFAYKNLEKNLLFIINISSFKEKSKGNLLNSKEDYTKF